MDSELKLGVMAHDRITGFTGRVTGLVDYISGCNQALIIPEVDKDGRLVEGHWFDVQRIEVLPGEVLVLDNGQTPGADVAAPKR